MDEEGDRQRANPTVNFRHNAHEINEIELVIPSFSSPVLICRSETPVPEDRSGPALWT